MYTAPLVRGRIYLLHLLQAACTLVRSTRSGSENPKATGCYDVHAMFGVRGEAWALERGRRHRPLVHFAAHGLRTVSRTVSSRVTRFRLLFVCCGSHNFFLLCLFGDVSPFCVLMHEIMTQFVSAISLHEPSYVCLLLPVPCAFMFRSTCNPIDGSSQIFLYTSVVTTKLCTAASHWSIFLVKSARTFP
ncbi:hypothetical protein R3P38DRAFT_2879698 [Favolaschia claudopus]|uniref:Secreted protein n=1 Tax=Favolaschia claudopus TaxID=2862362 RepID=A0AAW0CZQ1_9AGAR